MTKRPRTEMPITAARREAFLKTLAQTGSLRAACAASSPHSTGEQHASSTWHDLRRRDPEFEAQVQAALDHFVGQAEREVVRRAYEPETRRHFAKDGRLMSEEQSWREANKLLMAALRRHSPEWNERRQLEVEGRVQHSHYAIDPSLVMHLPRERQELLVDLLDEMSQIEQGLDPAKKIEAANE